MKQFAIFLAAMLCIAMMNGTGWGAPVYYSQGTGTFNTLSNWNSARGGSGSAPTTFSGNVFVVQNGHTMTTNSSVSLTSLTIENGGTVQADADITIGSSGTFQIDNGGTYIHNNNTASGSTIFNGTESFGTSSNFEVRNWQTSGMASGISFGNFTWNISSGGANPNLRGGLTTINGNFTVQATGGSGSLVLTGSDAYTLAVGGNLVISGGTLNMSNGSGVAAFNLSGNLDMSGGTLTKSGSASGTVTLSGTSNQTIYCPGLVSIDKINYTINNGNGVTLNSDFTIRGTLTLAGGKLALGSNNLTVVGPSGSISGGSASSYVVTDGTGELRCYAVGASNVLFPVGTSSTYNPVTINSSGTETYFVRVQSSFDNAPPAPDKVVNRQWTITNAPDGGTTATITLQWNSSDEASGFDRDASISIGRHNGSQWVGTSATLGNPSSGVYTATASGFTFFSPFAVGNESAVPVELTSFTAHVRSSTVELNWTTATEVNNFGFDVERNAVSLYDGWKKIGFVEGQGTSNTPHQYSYADRVGTFGKYSYRLKQIDRDGKLSYAPEVEVNFQPAVSYQLWQNYPNPFNPRTRIEFSLPTPGKVKLAIHDLLGQEVGVLVDETLDAGFHARDFDAANLSSGIYFYRLVAGGKVLTNRMAVVK